MYVGENESAKFWLSIMNGLKNRGVEDILIACVDGLNGFPQAVEAVYPKTEIQQCIIHQIRNSTKFVSYKDIKKLMADLMAIAKNLMEMLVPFAKESVGEINLPDITLTMEKTDGEIAEDNLDWEKEADMDAALDFADSF